MSDSRHMRDEEGNKMCHSENQPNITVSCKNIQRTSKSCLPMSSTSSVFSGGPRVEGDETQRGAKSKIHSFKRNKIRRE